MRRILALSLVATLIGIVIACGGSDGGNPPPATNTGQSCKATSECYPGLDASALAGETCLTQLQGGYCTHTCSADTDCCAVPGECPQSFKEVCASFESSNQKYCFLSCDSADLAADPDAGTTDSTAFCQRWAGTAFTCRSTGGGSENRKFCGP